MKKLLVLMIVFAASAASASELSNIYMKRSALKLNKAMDAAMQAYPAALGIEGEISRSDTPEYYGSDNTSFYVELKDGSVCTVSVSGALNPGMRYSSIYCLNDQGEDTLRKSVKF